MGHELTNSAVEHLRRFLETLVEDRDLDRAASEFAEDFTLTLYDQGGLVVRKDQAGAWFEDILNSSDTMTWSVDAVGVRGDLLCLIRHSNRDADSGFGLDILVVFEIGPDGLARRGARFRDENLKAAHDCLNQWWIEGLSPDLAELASAAFKLGNAIEDDPTALNGLLADSYVQTDHRPLSFGQIGKHEMIELILGRHQASPGFVMLSPTMERLTPLGVVATTNVIAPNGFFTDQVTVMILKDGQFTHIENFDPDHLDQALTRFEELTTPSP